MKINISVICLLIVSIQLSFAQIPVEKYRTEIETLTTKKQFNDYWDKLQKIDQDILVNTTELTIADSISVSNMIRTVLMFDIHGMDAYNPYSSLPILNLSHNYIGQSNLAYWPTIENCAEIGGAIKSFGGKYPAYPLEGIALTFYNYSVFQQETKYPKLMEKLSKIKFENTIDALLESYNYQKEIFALNEIEVLNQWYLQSAKDRMDDKTFAFVKMSDGNVYRKSYGRIQKLELLKTNPESKVYRTENEPFGWHYIYGKDGNLSLIDDKDNLLISYTLKD